MVADIFCLTRYEPGKLEEACAMTFPAYRDLLVSERDEVIAFSARLNGTLIGLSLAFVISARDIRLLSIFVQESCRLQGIGAALLNATERTAIARGAKQLSASFLWQGSCDHLVEFLSKTGWSSPIKQTLTLQVSTKRALAALSTIKLVPSKRSRIVPWRDFRPGTQTIPNRESWIPDELEPSRFSKIEEPTSFAIVNPSRTGIDGWVLTRRINAHQLAYSSSYIRPTLRLSGLLFEAYARSLAAAIASGYSIACLAVPSQYPMMVALVEKRLSSASSNSGYISHCTKVL
jgi:GNAT superfamily N-acetyltransferase